MMYLNSSEHQFEHHTLSYCLYHNMNNHRLNIRICNQHLFDRMPPHQYSLRVKYNYCNYYMSPY